jgi:hypothetical protein
MRRDRPRWKGICPKPAHYGLCVIEGDAMEGYVLNFGLVEEDWGEKRFTIGVAAMMRE